MNQAGRVGMMRGVARLPYKKRVEYLESTGTQWIDTGYYPTNDFLLQIGVQTDTNRVIFGAGEVLDTGSRTTPGFFVWPINNIGPSCFGNKSFHFKRTNIASSLHDVEWDKKHIAVDGVTKHSYTSTYSGTWDTAFRLFGTTSGAASYRLGVGRISYVKIYDASILLRDFIPVRFTNELGQSEGAMYDRANPTVGMNPDGSARTDGLYRNRGTGAFLYGNDI